MAFPSGKSRPQAQTNDAGLKPAFRSRRVARSDHHRPLAVVMMMELVRVATHEVFTYSTHVD